MHENQPRALLLHRFAERYQLADAERERVGELYEIDALLQYLPETPDQQDVAAFKAAIGATAESGYLDYQKSTNTFEVLMRWQESTGHGGFVPPLHPE